MSFSLKGSDTTWTLRTAGGNEDTRNDEIKKVSKSKRLYFVFKRLFKENMVTLRWGFITNVEVKDITTIRLNIIK